MASPDSTNVFLDNEDMRWHLEHSVDWPTLVKLVENDFRAPDGPESVEEARELYDAILEEAGRFIARECLPHAETLDVEHPKLVDGEVVYPDIHRKIFQGLKDMELLGLAVPREVGGMGCPLIVNFCVTEMLARADAGIMTHHGFFNGIATALLVYASLEGAVEVEDGQIRKTRYEDAIRACATGEAWGAMVLTEPGAGSDLAATRAVGRQEADGTWRVSGEKIFITSGDGQHHVVLARTEDESLGLKALSLFHVERVIERDGKEVRNVLLTKLEDKLGHGSSATLALLYEDSEAELIGQRGEGFKLMLTLMNGARIAVGFEALGVCEAAYRMAVKYASERRSMGRFLREHELIADMLEEMDTDIRGIRALAFEAMRHAELQQRLEMKLRIDPPADALEHKALSRRARRHSRRARDLTPLLKYLGGEKVVEIARRNMQIHGGMGYIKETGADRLLRDALVVPVYEGTSQIQALMALKDRLGAVIKDPVTFMRRAMEARVRARTTRGTEQRLWQAEVLVARAIEHIVWRVLGRKVREEWKGQLSKGSLMERFGYLTQGFLRSWDAKQDFSFGLLHAERLTQMLSDLEVGRVLWRQGAEHPERLVYAERYIRRMLPRMTARAMEITGDVIEPDEVVAAAAGPNGAHTADREAVTT
jgi:alkylation response protein AidB-like acyl-CoA dehydrogenase